MPTIALIGLPDEQRDRFLRIIQSLSHLLETKWTVTDHGSSCDLLIVDHQHQAPAHQAVMIRSGPRPMRRAGERWLSYPISSHEIFSLLQELSMNGSCKPSSMAEKNKSTPEGNYRLRAWPRDWWRWPDDELLIVARLALQPSFSLELRQKDGNDPKIAWTIGRLQTEGLLEMVEVDSTSRPVAPNAHGWWKRVYENLRSLFGLKEGLEPSRSLDRNARA